VNAVKPRLTGWFAVPELDEAQKKGKQVQKTPEKDQSSGHKKGRAEEGGYHTKQKKTMHRTMNGANLVSQKATGKLLTRYIRGKVCNLTVPKGSKKTKQHSVVLVH